jgi:hypothetical protein
MPRPLASRDSLDAAYNAENVDFPSFRRSPPVMHRNYRDNSAQRGVSYRLTSYTDGTEDDTVDIDVNKRSADASTLCPFDGALTCETGCMGCDTGVTCCNVGDSCKVMMHSQSPCPFVSYLSECMMCDNERGEPTLIASKPGDTCVATNFCTSFSKVPKRELAAGVAARAPNTHPLSVVAKPVRPRGGHDTTSSFRVGTHAA